MTKKVVGSIVATVIKSGLKTVLYVHKDGGTVWFTKPDQPDWSHVCHPSNEKNAEGWVREAHAINAPTFRDVEYFPLDI